MAKQIRFNDYVRSGTNNWLEVDGQKIEGISREAYDVVVNLLLIAVYIAEGTFHHADADIKLPAKSPGLSIQTVSESKMAEEPDAQSA